jgi:hypothetical protein
MRRTQRLGLRLRPDPMALILEEEENLANATDGARVHEDAQAE